MQKSRPTPPHVAERAATRYTTTENGCWESTYTATKRGSCTISWRDHGTTRTGSVHRAAWVYHNGQQLPERSTIVQTCGNKKCVNPDHLKIEVREKDQCRRGHGTEHWKKIGKYYQCAECKRQALRRSRERQRESLQEERERQRREVEALALEKTKPKSCCVSTGCLKPRREHERPSDPPGLCEYHYGMAMNQPKQRAEEVAA